MFLNNQLESNIYQFVIDGDVNVDKRLTTNLDWDGSVLGFNLADGKSVDLIMGLRVTNSDGTEDYYFKSEDFKQLGFEIEAFHYCEFRAVKEENPVHTWSAG